MASSINNDRTDVFAYFAGCGSMVKMTTGAIIGGIVRTDYVVVHDACPRVVQEVIAKFKMVSLTEDGLLIPLNDKSGTSHV